MIWTEEENQIRELDNMLNRTNETCKDCRWGGYSKGDNHVTCGHHISNFIPTSWCSYWTAKDDPKVNAYNEKRKAELRQKLEK